VPEYVYGIVGPKRKAPDRNGIGGSPVRLISCDGVAALANPLRDSSPELGRDELLMHAAVLEAALAEGTVLPMRFGTVIESEEAVKSGLLKRHAAELREELARLEGKIELRIRAVYEQESLLREVVSGNPEIARRRSQLKGRSTDATYYDQIELGELVAQEIQRKRERDAEQLLATLSPLAEAVDVSEAPHERIALNASFLVDRGRIREFDAVLDKIAAAQADRMRLKYTGPLPPHSFVEMTTGA
jgi:hypothetical protein